MSSPPITEAVKLPGVILVNLNRPPAADAIKAPRIIPRFKTVVESAKIDACRAAALSPCQ